MMMMIIKTLTAVMNLVPWGWRSSSFWNMEGEAMEEGGLEEHRKGGVSLLLKESMLRLGCSGMVRVLSPLTLSLEGHWDDVSELSLFVTYENNDSYGLTAVNEPLTHGGLAPVSCSARLPLCSRRATGQRRERWSPGGGRLAAGGGGAAVGDGGVRSLEGSGVFNEDTAMEALVLDSVGETERSCEIIGIFPYDGGPHSLDICRAGLQDERVLGLPPTEPNLKADKVFKQEDVAEVFPPSTPDYELVLAAELTLLFQVHLRGNRADNMRQRGTIQILCLALYADIDISFIAAHAFSTYITTTNGIHGQQVVAMAKLKLDHLLCGAEVAQLLLLGLTALLDQVFQQQSVFTHPLDGLQQVGGQVHLVPELHLHVLEGETLRIIMMVSLLLLRTVVFSMGYLCKC
ncbi:hypothetical protein F7725_018552 [Dissostichus mawsoni]|uniref:Uncharacterized protein n=1 Tax=Dissostichus mawsoni TaxID=36200 RepID=A0A7J5XRS1_DISMA|nr:hypothetical protein F7725_018552 [Dissostichus mawsoni]